MFIIIIFLWERLKAGMAMFCGYKGARRVYIKKNYERERYVVPDPSRYYIKDFPGYAAVYYPEVEVILPKYSRPVYTAKNTTPKEDFRVYISVSYAEQHLIQKMI